MYFEIENGEMFLNNSNAFVEKKEGIEILTTAEWDICDMNKEFVQIQQDQKNIHFCKLEAHADFMYGTIKTPGIKKEERHVAFAFYIFRNKIIFIDDTNQVKMITEKIMERKKNKVETIRKYFFDFLTCLIEDDILYLNRIEKEISLMEEQILKGQTDHFNRLMLPHKKVISKLYRYYGELVDIGQELCENDKDFFQYSNSNVFDVFKDRANRLQNETQVLREYAMQVQDLYQTEIGIRQNDIMKVLTIVTTIFFPLSLITGWYGMNFYNMPELQWKYGYIVIIVISIVVVTISLWFFKKKKFW